MKRQTLFTLISLLLTILATASTKDTPDIRIARFLDGKSAAISYTFDDGYVEHLRVVAPEMEKNGFRGTFWVNGTTHEGNANNQPDRPIDLVEQESLTRFDKRKNNNNRKKKKKQNGGNTNNGNNHESINNQQHSSQENDKQHSKEGNRNKKRHKRPNNGTKEHQVATNNE